MQNPLALIQLPDDVESRGYVETRPFHHEQVFYSKKHGFIGTEKQFLARGLAYAYTQTSAHTRVVAK